ncbi:MAG: CCA tRNA nucleotidyltransferase [Candidatus Stahlbacteria bacterium]|nr:MAG: CCA tRNA nucleotidyltransferase [Candidatus Stahlbacteria bacterium]
MKATPTYIIEKLCDAGHDTYIVGGAIRDLLSGRTPSDIDIATSANFKQIEELFKGHKIATGGTYFKVAFVDGIEVGTFRKDTYKGLNDKDVKIVEAKTIIEDLARRDLTINSMAFCQFTGDVIDPYEGQDDLKKRKIRFVGDAKERIYEDPNRIIRACRFLAVIDGIFEPSTKESLKEMSYLIKGYVSPERIHIEIMKAMKARYASVFFNALHEIGALQYILPSLDCCYYFDVHGLHHRESIITHSLLAGDSISTKYPLTKLATYLHDVGKPLACRFNPKTKDIKFASHDVEGKYLVIDELKRLTFTNKEIDYIATLIRLHMHSFKTEKAIRRVAKKLNEHDIDLKDLYRLGLADAKANIMKGHYPYSAVKANLILIDKALGVESPNRFDQLVVDGKDIMEIAGLKTGPEIGRIKNLLLDAILDNPDLNNKSDLEKIIRGVKNG